VPKFERYTQLYEAFELVLDRCVIHDKSMIWPDQQIWTLDNLHLLQDRFINAPIYGKTLNFKQKLIEQLGKDKPILWALIADLFFIFCLPSNKLLYETKLRSVQQFADIIPFTFPDGNDPIWEFLKEGFCNPGQRYNQKYRQFWLTIKFFIALKESGNPQSLIDDRIQFQTLLDEALSSFDAVDRATDTRYAFLFLTFPDYYEPIISSRHKEEIVSALWEKVGGDRPEDIDDALFAIRRVLQMEQDDPEKLFHFYHPPIAGLWRDIVAPINHPLEPIENGGNSVVTEIINTTKFIKNIILYGPPGTGKTYFAKKVAHELIKEQLNLQSKNILIQEIVDAVRVFELIALAMYFEGAQGKYSVKQINGTELLQQRYILHPIKNERNNIWSSLQLHSNPDSHNINVSNRADPALFDKNDEAEWYLTQEGVTYIDENLSDYIQKMNRGSGKSSESDFIFWITFHQSFSYEEFVEGLRPVEDGESTSFVNIEVVPGVFRHVCSRAAANPDQKFVLVIDEINRGSISRVFGELITLLEDDKRAGQANEISVVLPYSKDVFKVPQNLFIIGTMNTADRSITLLDAALRRRFAFIEITADPELLADIKVGTGDESVNLGQLLESINHKIIALLDRDHQIGHSYLLQVAGYSQNARIRALEFAWNYQIIPLLEEYFYSQPDQLIEIVKPFIDTEIDLDVNRSMRLIRLEGDELLSALVELIQIE
jgi:Cdc6-like AAA superfamily ATPase